MMIYIIGLNNIIYSQSNLKNYCKLLNYFSQDFFGKVDFRHFKNVQKQEILKSLEKL